MIEGAHVEIVETWNSSLKSDFPLVGDRGILQYSDMTLDEEVCVHVPGKSRKGDCWFFDKDQVRIVDPGPDMVNHPPHYTSHPKGFESIDVIEDAPNGLLFSTLKYLWRVCWGNKGDDVQDLKKARWYLDREIARREVG